MTEKRYAFLSNPETMSHLAVMLLVREAHREHHRTATRR